MKTKEKIIISAKEIFHKKGFAGARMQEIADASGVNKALLHYHFKSKDVLFRAVLLAGVAEIFPLIMSTLNGPKPLREKIISVVELYINQIAQNPQLPGFVLNELTQNPNFIQDNLQGMVSKPTLFISQMEEAIRQGEILPTDPIQLIASIIGLCVFPFIGKPMIQFISGKNEKEFQQFIVDRKAHIEALLLNGLFCKNN